MPATCTHRLVTYRLRCGAGAAHPRGGATLTLTPALTLAPAKERYEGIPNRDGSRPLQRDAQRRYALDTAVVSVPHRVGVFVHLLRSIGTNTQCIARLLTFLFCTMQFVRKDFNLRLNLCPGLGIEPRPTRSLTSS